MKKFISLFLSIALLCVLFSACANNNSESDVNGEVTSGTLVDNANENDEQSSNQLTEVPSGFIGIYTVDDLINSGNNEYGKYILMADLDLSEIEDWESISNRGEFNGNYHVISNLKSTQGGLFKHCENVENVIMKDVNIDYNEDNGDDWSAYIGAIGNSSCGIISDCEVSGNIKCVLSGKNTEKSNGETYNSQASVGGIIGYVYIDENKNDALISNCINNIVVEAKNNAQGGSLMVGGVVGSSSEELKVTECENNSMINVSQKYSNDADSSLSYLGVNGAGGIAGYAYYGSVSLTKCINRGNIKSDCNTGGITGTGEMYADNNEITLNEAKDIFPNEKF